PGLANRLIAQQCMSVTTSFEYEKRPLGERVSDEPLTTPMRYAHIALPTREAAVKAFGLDPHQSIVCVYGGGQGAHALNIFVERTLDVLLRFTQIIHVTGQGKDTHLQQRQRKGYVVRSLLSGEEMGRAHAAADLEITRAGIGTLSEIAGLKKAALIIPIPDTQQEANAHAFEERGAVMVFDQASSTFDEDVVSSAKILLQDRSERQAMGERANAFFPTDDGTAFAKRILHHLASRV
ncbi:UDP-N-acetylglucosamine--N-acetylmuramyl-(pentapeptide) pyrophosphoryl-undecaprenol N-acetylglucosamine transferase, partial [Patescibacteria group bacterium]|nr:UDP-N-acetylglucosamine--N-acetylmuramyl-(pentapeptide) pyrophosphoryl-undecaprenol N-acetylglucosamine transferase [Patescibacteria group bacterium]